MAQSTARQSALRIRTPAERAAIDARADAWQRPLSATQCSALEHLERACRGQPVPGFQQGVAGWHAVDDGGLHAFQTQTMFVLLKRGLAKRSGSGIVITAAGRKAARQR